MTVLAFATKKDAGIFMYTERPNVFWTGYMESKVNGADLVAGSGEK